jgi:hypothetical protein
MPPNKPPNRKKRRAAKLASQPLRWQQNPTPHPSIRRRLSVLVLRFVADARYLGETHPWLIRWLATAGLLLVGGVGVMQHFFWPSVVAFYVGLILLASCLFLQKMNRRFRYASLSLIVVVGVSFDFYVLQHKSPMSYGYLVTNGHVELVIRNDSAEDDYQNVDMSIIPDSRTNVFVGSASPTSGSYPDCTIIPSVPDEVLPGERVMAWSDEHSRWSLFSNQIRIRCQTLPRMSHLRLIVQPVSGTPLSGRAPFAVLPQGVPSLTGQFTNGFVVVKVKAPFKQLN